MSRRGPTNQYPRMLRIRCCYNSKRRVMKMSSSFLQFQGTSEYFSQYASQSGEVLGVLKQFLVEMNINIAAAEATEFEHKKTFDELSDTKIEEIAASNQQHKEKSLKSRRRNSRTIVTRQNKRGPRSPLGIRRDFLRISASWTSARFRKLLRLLRPSMRMKIMHAITSAKRSKLELCLRPTCKAFPPLGRGSASGVWLERRAEVE